ncbi:MAG: hypothetical protein LWX56_10885 [Ignavibacteria bacterium]|nr:hypothetical protein [Ignavibacteria bacterium]
MKAYECLIRISKEGVITIPPKLMKILPKEQDLRSLVLVPEAEDQKYRTAVNDINQQEFSYYIPPSEGIYDEY